jgi:hypothetical protein
VLPGGWREAFLRTHAACQQVLHCWGGGSGDNCSWHLCRQLSVLALQISVYQPCLVLSLCQYFRFCSCAARAQPAGSGQPTRRL